MSGIGWRSTRLLDPVPDRIRSYPSGWLLVRPERPKRTMQTYVIAHVTGTSYLGKSGWTSKSFARRFDTYEAAEDFLIECGLDFEGANVEAV